MGVTKNRGEKESRDFRVVRSLPPESADLARSPETDRNARADPRRGLKVLKARKRAHDGESTCEQCFIQAVRSEGNFLTPRETGAESSRENVASSRRGRTSIINRDFYSSRANCRGLGSSKSTRTIRNSRGALSHARLCRDFRKKVRNNTSRVSAVSGLPQRGVEEKDYLTASRAKALSRSLLPPPLVYDRVS